MPRSPHKCGPGPRGQSRGPAGLARGKPSLPQQSATPLHPVTLWSMTFAPVCPSARASTSARGISAFALARSFLFTATILSRIVPVLAMCLVSATPAPGSHLSISQASSSLPHCQLTPVPPVHPLSKVRLLCPPPRCPPPHSPPPRLSANLSLHAKHCRHYLGIVLC